LAVPDARDTEGLYPQLSKAG